MKNRLPVAVCAAVVLGAATVLDAYELLGRTWRSGSVVTLVLRLGSNPVDLIDGSTSWNDVVEDAWRTWGETVGGVTLISEIDAVGARGFSNGRNEVVWADSVDGQAFNAATHAATLRISGGDGYLQEADVLFDRAAMWNAYRGAAITQPDGNRVLDMRRIALRELGYVLGLNAAVASPTDTAPPLLYPFNPNTDALTPDDVQGARAMYGLPFTSNRSPQVTLRCSPCVVRAHGTVTLIADPSDPDLDTLRLHWPANAFSPPVGSGRFAAGWSAPLAPGLYPVRVTATDGRGGSGYGEVMVQVTPTDRMASLESLPPSGYIVSPNGRYRLTYQSDGNLVLSDDVEQVVVWSTETVGRAGDLTIQADGNLVMRDAAGQVVWATYTTEPRVLTRLVLQDDGNLVLSAGTRVLWDSKSA
ncbi:MAG: bulb-type lectin domain-containing protein [Vicinamibacterales bacterium]